MSKEEKKAEELKRQDILLKFKAAFPNAEISFKGPKIIAAPADVDKETMDKLNESLGINFSSVDYIEPGLEDTVEIPKVDMGVIDTLLLDGDAGRKKAAEEARAKADAEADRIREEVKADLLEKKKKALAAQKIIEEKLSKIDDLISKNPEITTEIVDDLIDNIDTEESKIQPKNANKSENSKPNQ